MGGPTDDFDRCPVEGEERGEIDGDKDGKKDGETRRKLGITTLSLRERYNPELFEVLRCSTKGKG